MLKRERMAKLREEIAVQKAMETELNKTIHITGLFSHSSQILCMNFSITTFLFAFFFLFPCNRADNESKTIGGNNVSRDKISNF